MKKSENSLSFRERIVSVLLIFILLFFSIVPFYYDFNFNKKVLNPCIATRIIQKEENVIEQVVHNYLKTLKEQQYCIMSNSLDFNKLLERKSLASKDIIDCLTVNISCIELNIEGELFYFKDRNECDTFIEKIKVISPNQSYTIEEKHQELNNLSKQEDLDLKLAAIEKEKVVRLAKVSSRSISSRSGNVNTGRQSNINSVLASYIYISSNYGMRNGKMHTGVDIAASAGTNIYAWKNGVVTFAGWNGNYGYQVIIDHQDGTMTTYAHCSKIYVAEGQYVTKGSAIAGVGSTGNSTGPHLHFELKINGSFVNPLNYL